MSLLKSERRRVLLIAMADSVHVARWIRQFSSTEIEFVLFPATPNRRLHPLIADMIRSKDGNRLVSVAPIMRYASLPLGVADLAPGVCSRALLLRRILSVERFDYIHVLEFQHAGYLLLQALGHAKPPAPVIVTNWGSDIYWFGRFPEHRVRIESLLAIADFYSAECSRDRILAEGMGFRGEFLAVHPNAGGLPTERYRTRAIRVPPSRRRLIAVKGYDSFVGLASVALQAVELCSDRLRDYEIVFYSTGRRMRRAIAGVAGTTGLSIRGIAPYGMSHHQMMELFLESRVYLGVSKSDGISTSLLEAMTAGCFPLQTSTSCADEWVTDGITGLIIADVTAPSVAAALTRSVVEDSLVDHAMSINLDVVADRLDAAMIARDSRTFYGL